MLLFLPDFIGHPSCFNKLSTYLSTHKPGLEQRIINYHSLNYQLVYKDKTVFSLAKTIKESLDTIPSKIIGYSFGGLVGIELLKLCQHSERILIDTHLPQKNITQENSIAEYNNWIDPEMKNFIEQLSILNEINMEVIYTNLTLYKHWKRIPEPLPTGILIRCCTSRKDHKKTVSFDKY